MPIPAPSDSQRFFGPPVSVPNWYAVYTRARHEKSVNHQLRTKSIETFLPVYKQRKRWNNGLTVQTEMPLFPGYLFTRIPLDSQLDVLRVPGVVDLVKRGGLPVPVAEQEIMELQVALAALCAEPYPFLTAGQRVRIVSGPLSGAEGFLVERRNGYKVAICLNVIQRSFAVEVDVDQIEVIG
jgi:transcription antitermination factor NusG